MPRFNEKSAVEDYIVEQLQSKGWAFVPGNALDRDNFEEPLLIRNLIKQVKAINPIDLSDEDIKNLLNELGFKPSTQEGIKQMLLCLKEGISIKIEKDKTLKRIRLFDYDNVQNNVFIVTRQAVYTRGNKQIRTDILLYVNGIPLVDIESKNPASFSENWYDAFKQIKSYEQDIPELYKYVQIGVAAEQIAKYFPIVPWNENVKIDEWKSEKLDSIDSVIQLFIPETLLDILNNFVYVRVQFGESTKVLPRYMQYRAVGKVVQRVINNIEGKEEKNKGLIWHWQGSGKTLEMIFAANKLYRSETMENPTLFLIVDRQDLEEQLYDEFTALELTIPELIGSVTEMRKVLQHDDGRGKRGIFITLIHKFRPEELSVLQKELEKLSSKKETILTRKNVVAFVDEGHRTQYGTLAAQMRAILRNTSFFAFTGTPVSKPKHGVDTYDVFSYPPEEKYLDKYFITDSINDGFTVKIAYQPRLEKEVHLNKEMLDTFLDVEFEEITEDVIENLKEEQLQKIMIVTDMLLTGFDAPILQTMYLDKPLKEHRLLQAVARTNRPYKDVKEAGLILDYIGILKEFKRAFEIYSKEEINGALFSIEEIRKDFVRLMNQILDIFKEVPKNQYDRKTLLKSMEILTSHEEKSKAFIEDYKHMTKIFELLGPDTIKAELFSEYQWISAIYTYYTRLVLRSQPKDNRYLEQYFKKTIKYIHKTTELEEIQKSLPIIEFDENYFRRLEEHVKNKEEKAANIVFTLNRFVLVDKFKNPVSESLSEKVQRLLNLWKEKIKDYEKIYQEGVKVIKEFMQLSERQKDLKLSKLDYSLLLVLENKFGENAEIIDDIRELSTSLNELIFSGWISQPTAQKEVEKTVRLFIRKYIKRYNLEIDDLNTLFDKLMDRVKAYAKED